MRRLTVFVLFGLITISGLGVAHGKECAGVSVPDQVQVEGSMLVLNGVGLRQATMLKVNVYVAALYTAKATSDPDAILGSSAPKQLVLHFVRNVGAADLNKAWEEGFTANARPQLPALQKRIDTLKSWMADMKTGERLTLTHKPGAGIQVNVAGTAKGTIEGDDFARAFLSIWLGAHPPNAGLKAGLAPWQTSNLPPLTTDVWDLYDVRTDFSLTRNLAAQQPAKLKQMQALFMKEAQKYHVLPIDDRVIERLNPAIAGRPDVLGNRTSLVLYEGMQGMLENTFMNIKNRSSKITAELEIPAGGANGAILSQGGRFGGWSLYMKDGKPAYTYNFLGLARYTVAAPEALPAGSATVTLDFAYDGGGVGKGGKAVLYVNGKPVAEGRVEKTQPNIFSADETADVGIDNQTPVAEGIGIGPETRFTGKINKVTLEVK